jgi:hypothetical protein
MWQCDLLSCFRVFFLKKKKKKKKKKEKVKIKIAMYDKSGKLVIS